MEEENFVVDALSFTTKACTYCRMAHPHVIGYVMDNDLSHRVVNADPDTNTEAEKELCTFYNIQSVPVVVLQHGTEEPLVLRGFGSIMTKVKE